MRMSTSQYLKKGLNIKDLSKLLKDRRYLKDTYYTEFPHSGLWLFCGSQGQGKTASALQFVVNILRVYPKCHLVTNVDFKLPADMENQVYAFTSTDDLATYGSNGLDGVIFFIDEIHLCWNSLESKSITPADMIEFAQSRKQRRLIVGTSQRLNRLAKPAREQLKYVVDCHCFFGLLQRNMLINMDEAHEMPDGTLMIEKARNMWFFHDWNLRHSYDTYQKMTRITSVKPVVGGWRK